MNLSLFKTQSLTENVTFRSVWHIFDFGVLYGYAICNLIMKPLAELLFFGPCFNSTLSICLSLQFSSIQLYYIIGSNCPCFGHNLYLCRSTLCTYIHVTLSSLGTSLYLYNSLFLSPHHSLSLFLSLSFFCYKHILSINSNILQVFTNKIYQMPTSIRSSKSSEVKPIIHNFGKAYWQSDLYKRCSCTKRSYMLHSTEKVHFLVRKNKLPETFRD